MAKKKAKKKVKAKAKPTAKKKAKKKVGKKAKTRNGPVTRTPGICDSNWPANPGDTVAWTGAPTGGTTIYQAGNNTWPFNLASPFQYPNPSQVMIRTNLPPGNYYYVVAYCTAPADATKIVNVG